MFHCISQPRFQRGPFVAVAVAVAAVGRLVGILLIRTTS